MSENLKIVFAGTPEIAKIILEKILASGFNVELILTKPDSIAGRGKKLTPSAVKELALKYGISVLTPVSLRKNIDTVEQIRSIQPDIMIVVAYGLILPQEILDIPRLGCVNIHVSLLPRHRGAAPILRSVLEGDKTSGITIIQMDSGLDTGDVLLQTIVELGQAETSGTLHDKLAILGSDLIIEYLYNYSKITPMPQSRVGVTYAHKIEKQEAKIDWNQDVGSIDRQIRAFNPFPGAFCYLKNELVKVWRADTLLGGNTQVEAGTITAASGDGVMVAVKNGSILIQELQFSGKKRISAKEYLNGAKNIELIGQKYT